MSANVTNSIRHDKAGKGYFYLFKYSDFEPMLSRLITNPLYIYMAFSRRIVNKSSAVQKQGEWLLGYCSIPSHLSAHLPDRNTIGVDIFVYTLPNQRMIDAQINRQQLKKVCLDQMQSFFKQALKVDISSITLTLLMESGNLKVQNTLGRSTEHGTISLEVKPDDESSG